MAYCGASRESFAQTRTGTKKPLSPPAYQALSSRILIARLYYRVTCHDFTTENVRSYHVVRIWGRDHDCQWHAEIFRTARAETRWGEGSLISDGWFKTCRNTNYLGEMLLMLASACYRNPLSRGVLLSSCGWECSAVDFIRRSWVSRGKKGVLST